MPVKVSVTQSHPFTFRVDSDDGIDKIDRSDSITVLC